MRTSGRRSNALAVSAALLALSPLLSGCLGLLAAGAGTAAITADQYKDAKEKQNKAVEKEAVRRARGQWDQQQQQALDADERLKAELTERYLGGQLTRILTIYPTVQNGVVTLVGNVPDRIVAERAVDLARRMKGVKAVESRLVVVPVKLTPLDREALLEDLSQTLKANPQQQDVPRPLAPDRSLPPGYQPPLQASPSAQLPAQPSMQPVAPPQHSATPPSVRIPPRGGGNAGTLPSTLPPPLTPPKPQPLEKGPYAPPVYTDPALKTQP